MRFSSISLRSYLLAGILVPIGIFVAVNAFSLYRKTLQAVNTAYDRTLLASAKSIGEQLDVQGYDEQAVLRATVPYSALEAFEADVQTRMYYRVSSLQGRLVSGFDDLPFSQGQIAAQPPYAALVDFYDTSFRDSQVRVAVLLQPVASPNGRGMAVIQVAETLELRRRLSRRILIDFLWQQALLVAVIALVVVVVVQAATRPVRRLSGELQARPEGDLTLPAADAPRELLPLVDATNEVMARLAHMLENQKRFVRDTSHQLRTPLAVLKTQVQSALRGDVDPRQALQEINGTVERATVLANQMLSLAKVEQLREQAVAQVNDLSQEVRDGAGAGAADRRQGHRLRHRDASGAGAGARVDAARALAQPAAQRHQAHAARRHALGARAHRRQHGGTGGERQRSRHPGRAAAAAVPALLRRRRARRLGTGPGHLPRDRARARRHHRTRKP